MLTLDIQPRTTETTDALRAKGLSPAVLYGPKEEAASIIINTRKLESIWKQAGETTIITLKGAGEDKDSLIHDVQFHPVTSAILHADFYILEKGKKIRINIPLEFVGLPPAEKLGHVVVKALHEVEIEVAPAELPQHLTIDMTKLSNVGDHITAGQIELPKSAELISGADEIVASVTSFVEEKVEEAAPAAEGEAAAPAEGEAATPAEGETAAA